jgi:hypothetical protein
MLSIGKKILAPSFSRERSNEVDPNAVHVAVVWLRQRGVSVSSCWLDRRTFRPFSATLGCHLKHSFFPLSLKYACVALRPSTPMRCDAMICRIRAPLGCCHVATSSKWLQRFQMVCSQPFQFTLRVEVSKRGRVASRQAFGNLLPLASGATSTLISLLFSNFPKCVAVELINDI